MCSAQQSSEYGGRVSLFRGHDNSLFLSLIFPNAVLVPNEAYRMFLVSNSGRTNMMARALSAQQIISRPIRKNEFQDSENVSVLFAGKSYPISESGYALKRLKNCNHSEKDFLKQFLSFKFLNVFSEPESEAAPPSFILPSPVTASVDPQSTLASGRVLNPHMSISAPIVEDKDKVSLVSEMYYLSPSPDIIRDLENGDIVPPLSTSETRLTEENESPQHVPFGDTDIYESFSTLPPPAATERTSTKDQTDYEQSLIRKIELLEREKESLRHQILCQGRSLEVSTSEESAFLPFLLDSSSRERLCRQAQ